MNKALFLFFLILIVSCKEDSKYENLNKDEGVFISSAIIPDNHFLGDRKCKTCHEKEYENWQGSHHDKSMQVADSLSVLGDFKNTTFNSQRVISRFYKRGHDFFVNTEGPDGENHDYKIVYTFGVAPLQQYIVKFPDGHYQCLRTAWNTIENKWFDLYPDFKVVHSEWLHWSRGGLNWNNMCSDCHSTNIRENYNEQTHSYNTKYAIINVSCEACHGPGKQHVEDVNRLGKNYNDTATLQMTFETTPKELVDECARCHMRREQFSSSFNFEGSMLDHYFPQLITENLYYPDGQILDEVYVYGSFVQSKMYQNDVACNNCHDSHSLKLKFEGNALCTQCHISEKYNTPKHHFHKEQTEGALCINCHMPGKMYMGNDFRRDHSFRVPRPDLSLKYNTPNACVGCHEDKTNQWVWDAFKELFGTVDSMHYSEKLIPGILKEPDAHIGLEDLIANKQQPEIIRASAARVLSNYNTTGLIEKYIALLNDESPLVRATSLDVLADLNNTDYTKYFLPLLNDSKRTVRIKAFYALGSLLESQIPEEYKNSYQKVKSEFSNYLNINADFVGGRIKKANYYLKQGRLQKAIEGYESALKIDSLNNHVRLELANLYYRNREYKKVEATYKTIILIEPEYGPAYYSLGLLYAELSRTIEAIEQMEKAAYFIPENIRVYYNLGLLYDKNDEKQKAEKILIKGLTIESNNESLLYALAYHYNNNNNIEKAKKIVMKLVQLYPNNAQYQNFLKQLSSLRARG